MAIRLTVTVTEQCNGNVQTYSNWQPVTSITITILVKAPQVVNTVLHVVCVYQNTKCYDIDVTMP